MDTKEILGLVFRWLHIIPMAMLVGGTIFMRLSLVPAANETAASAELREAIRRRWAKWVGISILLLLASGLYNATTKIVAFELPPTYSMLVLVKLGLGLLTFFLVSLLSGRSSLAQKFRKQELMWLNIVCALLLTLVLAAGYMKLLSTGAPPKDRSDKTETVHRDGLSVFRSSC